MKKSALFAVLAACSVVTAWLLAQSVPGVPVNGPIVPTDYRDVYSTLDPWFAQGGFRNATNLNGLTNITGARKLPGMIAYTSSDSKHWKLANDLATWTEIVFASSSGGITNNIYTSDGALTGPRQVHLASFPLTFDGTSGSANFNILTPGVVQFIGSSITNATTTYGVKATNKLVLNTEGTLDIRSGGTADINSVIAMAIKCAAGLLLQGGSLNIISLAGIVINADTSIAQTAVNQISLDAPKIKLVTAGVKAGTIPTNTVAKLVNLDGTIEFGADLGGDTNGVHFGTATLSGGVYTVAVPTPPYTNTVSYPDFFTVVFRPNLISAGNESLKWGSGPGQPLKTSYGTAIPSGELAAGVNYMATWDTTATAWILKNSASTLAFNSTLTTSTTGSVTTVGINTNSLPSGASTNIYNSDGSLTGSRTVTMGGDSLTFAGSTGSDFTVSGGRLVQLSGLNGVILTAGGAGGVISVTGGFASIDTANATITGSEAVTIETPGHAAAPTGQALRKTATGTVEYSADPTPPPSGLTNVVAGNITFTNAQSFISPGATAGPGFETKFGPLFIYKNGMFRPWHENIMFQFNSWGMHSSGPDSANWSVITGTSTRQGSVTGIAGLSGHVGINNMTTGIATNCYLIIALRGDAVDFEAGNKLYYFARVRVPVVSVSGGNAFKAGWGFGDRSTEAINDTDCIVITYSIDEAGGAWRLDCGAAGTHSYQTYGSAVTAGTWYDLEIEATSTRVDWAVNGVVQTAQVAGNIPTGANKFGPMQFITSYNGNGATTLSVHVDQVNTFGVYTF